MTLLTELVDFERNTARKRRHLANTAPSQTLRLHIAKDAFKNKEDALERLIVYHNTLATTEVAPQAPEPLTLKDRITHAEIKLRESAYFKEGLFAQVVKNLKVEVHGPSQAMKL